jgi:hypothetical protein
MKQAAIAALFVVLSLAFAAFAAHAASARLTTQQIRYWDAIAQCETGGNWQMHGSLFSGGVGFANSTWSWWASELGLSGRYPTADRAPRLVQMQVAEMGYERHNGGWGCARVVSR